ncbi:MAG: hemerythrin domain-containing protein [Planctomycetes bacterium]|nr:hemerythrin domain-containing protein [Planctomycetota bacterium]
MQTNRYNPYTYIHKGIRRELTDLLRIAANLDFADGSAAEPFVARLAQSVQLMHKHAEHEDHVIDPLMQQFAPKLARRVLATHKVLEGHEEEVLSLCDEAVGSPAVGYSLYLALSRYAATQFAHMSEEETDVVQAIWQNMDDAEIIAAENAIVSQIEPQNLAIYLTWMIHGVNEEERTTFINALKKGAPPEAVAFAEEQARAAREAQLSLA